MTEADDERQWQTLRLVRSAFAFNRNEPGLQQAIDDQAAALARIWEFVRNELCGRTLAQIEREYLAADVFQDTMAEECGFFLAYHGRRGSGDAAERVYSIDYDRTLVAFLVVGRNRWHLGPFCRPGERAATLRRLVTNEQ
jgi:hypothetical protein